MQMTRHFDAKAKGAEVAVLELGTQAYGWSQMAVRESLRWPGDMSWAMEKAVAAGIAGWEPLFSDGKEVAAVGDLMAQHQLSMRSFYMGGILHEPDKAPETIKTMVEIGAAASRYGAKLAVVNPDPIKWGAHQDKSDRELDTQRAALLALSDVLGGMGIKLCYHTHDAEMRASAREFHHMLASTDPRSVRLCLDPHWIYRGAGNSSIALMDIVALYGDRVEEIHLRQSRDHVWDETVESGDLDYLAILSAVLSKRTNPYLVLEHALEPGTPYTLDCTEAHVRSLQFIQGILAQIRAA